MAYSKKKIKEGKQDPKDKKKYTIEAVGANEEDIIILFKSDTDADRAKKVDKLSTEDLPTSGDGVTEIVWINNFWLKKGNGSYLNDMPYHVQLKKKNQTLVTFNGTAVARYTSPVTNIGTDSIQIELSIGDPAMGYGNG